MNRTFPAALLVLAGLLSAPARCPAQPAADAPPRALDDRLRVDLFAAAPDVVHPVGLDVDARGRVYVVESHTHFRPPNYKGPPADRIRVLEDTDGDGKADRIGTFFEGTRATMDLALHPDGSVWVATRNEVIRLRDTDGDGKADERTRIAFLDTHGDYPHNGLSGLCFDARGDVYFGMGENLGATYKLIGADGTTRTGGGEGGNVFWCTADGRRLRRVATGYWNPFGTARDVFGRLFTVDNDPDASPPCRLLHTVEGGDYGFQFRYGRAGRHVFQAWNGQLPGTLPMVAGTGEAPVEVVAYESDGLPEEYRGDLLVTAWADHQIERYRLKDRGASVESRALPFVQGGSHFHPSGMAVAPDGSLFVSDWVLKDYNLHGKGAVWHIRPKKAGAAPRPTDPRAGLASAHRPVRDAAARTLAAGEPGRAFLREQLASPNLRTRAAALDALVAAGDAKLDLAAFAAKEPAAPLRALAVAALAALAERGGDAARFLDPAQPAAVRREAVAGLRTRADLPRLLPLLGDPDPFLRQAAQHRLAASPAMLTAADAEPDLGVPQRQGLLLAWQASGQPDAARRVARFLADRDDDVRLLAAKWIADDKLTEYRPQVAAALEDRGLNVRLYAAFATALGRLDGRDVTEGRLADAFFERAADSRAAPALRRQALRLVPATHGKLTVPWLSSLLRSGDAELSLETARALAEHPSDTRLPLLAEVARDPKQPEAVRAQALVGLAEEAERYKKDLLALARGDSVVLRGEALRALTPVKLDEAGRKSLEEAAARHSAAGPLVDRVLGRPLTAGRPSREDVSAWLARLEGPADAEAGRRVFFHPHLAGCFRCHAVDGRGRPVGPELSGIGRTDRRHILESVLQPSLLVAPHYQAWTVETKDGKVRTGMVIHTNLDETTYLDAQGGKFRVTAREVESLAPAAASIMPADLVDRLTDQELRDLLAFLASRK